jgi:hypothetical protein
MVPQAITAIHSLCHNAKNSMTLSIEEMLMEENSSKAAKNMRAQPYPHRQNKYCNSASAVFQIQGRCHAVAMPGHLLPPYQFHQHVKDNRIGGQLQHVAPHAVLGAKARKHIMALPHIVEHVGTSSCKTVIGLMQAAGSFFS